MICRANVWWTFVHLYGIYFQIGKFYLYLHLTDKSCFLLESLLCCMQMLMGKPCLTWNIAYKSTIPHVLPAWGHTGVVCISVLVSNCCLLGHVAAETQLLCPNMMCGRKSPNTGWVEERTHTDVILGCSGCVHAAACPSRQQWDTSTGWMQHLYIPMTVTHNPARVMQLIVLCEQDPRVSGLG